jgi:hypothetical protein
MNVTSKKIMNCFPTLQFHRNFSDGLDLLKKSYVSMTGITQSFSEEISCLFYDAAKQLSRLILPLRFIYDFAGHDILVLHFFQSHVFQML